MVKIGTVEISTVESGEAGDARGVIRDGDGVAVATFRPAVTEAGPGGPGRPKAEDLTVEPGIPVARAAGVILDALPGWEAVADEETGAALLAAGARLVRHLHQYSWEPGPGRVDPAWADPAPPSGFVVCPVDAVEPGELYDAWAAAYPPGHPDAGQTVAADLDRLYRGGLLGPLLPCGGVVLDEGRVVAAMLVNDAGRAGPWVSEVFRSPGARYAGLGGLLIRRALALAAGAGLPRMGLAVTEGNPARALYERIGFRHTASRLKLQLPGKGE